jgi:sulfatase maturation enzyme AslB (radical SAM superfamily)
MLKEIESLFSKYNEVMDRITPLLVAVPPNSEGKTSTFIVTDDCNLRCSYCYLTDKKPDRMSWEVARDFIDMTFSNNLHLANIPAEDQIQFDHAKIWDFVGGEPFMEFELVSKIINYILEKTQTLPDNHPWKRGFDCKNCKVTHRLKGFRFAFSTNGTYLSDPKIREYLESHRDLISLGVTIDGPKDMHDACRVYPNGEGSFDSVMNSWEWYRKTFPLNAMHSKSTICHENLIYVGEIAKFFWEDLGMDYVNMNCVFENVWHKGDQLILFEVVIIRTFLSVRAKDSVLNLENS